MPVARPTVPAAAPKTPAPHPITFPKMEPRPKLTLGEKDGENEGLNWRVDTRAVLSSAPSEEMKLAVREETPATWMVRVVDVNSAPLIDETFSAGVEIKSDTVRVLRAKLLVDMLSVKSVLNAPTSAPRLDMYALPDEI